MFWNNILRTDKTKIHLYQSKSEKEQSAHDPNIISSSVKHGGGSIMAWAGIIACETSSLIFIDMAAAEFI